VWHFRRLALRKLDATPGRDAGLGFRSTERTLAMLPQIIDAAAR